MRDRERYRNFIAREREGKLWYVVNLSSWIPFALPINPVRQAASMPTSVFALRTPHQVDKRGNVPGTHLPQSRMSVKLFRQALGCFRIL
jgi:hypothetical protein